MNNFVVNKSQINLLADENVFDNSETLVNQSVNTIIEEPTLPYLIDKFTDVAFKYEGVGLILANAIGTSIIIFVVTKFVTQIISGFNKNQ